MDTSMTTPTSIKQVVDSTQFEAAGNEGPGSCELKLNIFSNRWRPNPHHPPYIHTPFDNTQSVIPFP